MELRRTLKHHDEHLQTQLDNVRLGDEDLSNTMQFKYLGVMQSVDGDSPAPVKERLLSMLYYAPETSDGTGSSTFYE